ncbi:MAG: adenylosuccinate lyase [Candidatus Cryosericum sp.]
MIDRYALPPVRDLWTERAQYERWLEVECAVTAAWEDLGVAPVGTADRVRLAAVIDVDDIHVIEATVDHDVIAFVKSVTGSMGDEARFFHLGMTSSDVVDTALGLALKQSGQLLLQQLDALHGVLADQAVRYRDTVVVGRTHGIHAEPTSFGLKFLSWLAETERNRERLTHATDGVACGKISGAVGNYANIDPRVEQLALGRLGLAASKCSTQVVPRDQHAEFVATLALVGAQVERMATEIRHLQRTEVREAQEPFKPGQRGSSAMPHKKNPILCERLCGMARLLRGYVTAAYEDIALWHERDISHSSVERVILPDAVMMTYYMLDRLTWLMQELVVDAGRMETNFAASHNLVFSQRVMLALVEHGMSRENAYTLIQGLALASWEREQDFRALCAADGSVGALLPPAELGALFDSHYYLRNIGPIYARFGLDNTKEEQS